LLVAWLVLAGLQSVMPLEPPTPLSPDVAAAAGDPVIAAAGDIACDPTSSSFNGGQGTSDSCKRPPSPR
jgi:hypothetical protein